MNFASISLVLAALVAFPAESEGARRSPDLKVVGLSSPPHSGSVGSSFKIFEKTRNGGNAKARSSKTMYFLSRNGRRDSRDLRIGVRRVGGLKPGKASAAKRRLRVPGRAKGGASYLLLACADAGRAVRERREGNNCRRGKRRMTISGVASDPTGTSILLPPSFPSADQPEPTPDPPAAPAGLSAVTVSAEEIALRWSAVSGAAEYQVRRAAFARGPFVRIATIADTSYSDTGLIPDQTYYYRVRAANAGGASPDSSTAATTTDFFCPDNGSDDVTPTDLGSIAGNLGADSTTRNSEICRGDVDLFSIEVRDDDTGTLSARFKLEMTPDLPGRDGDLSICVYDDTGPDPLECSEGAGTVAEQVTVSWPDVDGPDDTRTLRARVFGAGADSLNHYTLTIDGNVVS